MVLWRFAGEIFQLPKEETEILYGTGGRKTRIVWNKTDPVLFHTYFSHKIIFFPFRRHSL